jgi:hypothetical protein
VTHTHAAKPDLELNIGAKPEGCFIAYIPEDAINDGGNGGTGEYSVSSCKRGVGLLDLISNSSSRGCRSIAQRSPSKRAHIRGRSIPITEKA